MTEWDQKHQYMFFKGVSFAKFNTVTGNRHDCIAIFLFIRKHRPSEKNL